MSKKDPMTNDPAASAPAPHPTAWLQCVSPGCNAKVYLAGHPSVAALLGWHVTPQEDHCPDHNPDGASGVDGGVVAGSILMSVLMRTFEGTPDYDPTAFSKLMEIANGKKT